MFKKSKSLFQDKKLMNDRLLYEGDDSSDEEEEEKIASEKISAKRYKEIGAKLKAIPLHKDLAHNISDGNVAAIVTLVDGIKDIAKTEAGKISRAKPAITKVTSKLGGDTPSPVQKAVLDAYSDKKNKTFDDIKQKAALAMPQAEQNGVQRTDPRQ